ncbi:MAG: aspartate kinase, partial [Clostridiales bacterium]|nr:aspartate kinase [Clostridiales bacterium]
MSIKVSKFGGTSLADATQIRKVIDILRSDAERRFVVPSAPGKRHADDEKITDLLLACHRMAENGEDTTDIFGYICGRYDRIASDLGLKADLSSEYELIARSLKRGASRDYLASRGEYLCGRLLALALNWEFVDPAEVILFDARGRFDPDCTHEKLSARLRGARNAVIPGF